MFCSNCGKDCGKQLFCSKCGKQLYKDITKDIYEEKRRELHIAGKVYCPFCLSTNCVPEYQIGKKSYHRYPLAAAFSLIGKLILKNRERKYGKAYSCLNCGSNWYPKLTTIHDRYRQKLLYILGEHGTMVYMGCDNVTLHFEETRIVIIRPGKKEYVIPYRKLCNVYYDGCVGSMKGRLILRDCAHKRSAPPRTLTAAEKDKLTIFFDPIYKQGFYKLYSVLWAIVEENKKAGII